jgi:two-component sensor histidine kinase
VLSQRLHFQKLTGHRIKLERPPLDLSAAAGQTAGSAVHELAANAVKYGALSNSTGTVEIRWRLGGAEGSPQFAVSWAGPGGPTVTPPENPALPRMELEAEVTLDYRP